MTKPYQFARGETVALFAGALTGDATIASGVVAKIKPITAPSDPVPPASVAGTAMSVIYQAAAGAIPAGWNISLTGMQSAALSGDFYVIDLAFIVGGAAFVSQPIVIQMVNAVSIP